MQKHILLQNYMFCLTYEKLHILNKIKRHVPLKLPVILFCLLRMTTCIVYYYFEVIYVEKGVLGFKTISVQNLLCIRQRYAIDV